MTNVLVTGASGFIGGHLVPALQSKGYSVWCGVRAGATSASAADSAQRLTWQNHDGGINTQALADAGIDVVIHLAGLAHDRVAATQPDYLQQVNAQASAQLLEASQQAGVGTFIWLSSIKVLGEAAETPLPVCAPLLPESEYARSKAAGERALRATAKQYAQTRLVIVRPPLVYGPGVSANFLNLLSWVHRGVPLPLASASALRSMVGVGNLVDMLARCIVAPAGTYHVADPEDLSVAELLREVAAAMKRPARLFPVPVPLLKTLAKIVGRAGVAQRLLAPQRVATDDSQQRLDWQPPLSTRTQLEDTVAWFLAQR